MRASWNRNSFRPEVSVAHELRRYVSAHLPLPPIQLPGIRPRPSRRGVGPSAHQKINSVLVSTATGDGGGDGGGGGGSERRKERKKEQRNGRTNRVIALVLTAVGCTEATVVVVIRVGGASAAALFCKVVFRVSLTPFLARPRPARARILYCV